MKNLDESNVAEQVGQSIGVGLLAGLAGTVAITLSQIIEMKLTRRKPSTAPADAASKVLKIKPASKSQKKIFSQGIHWLYGTSWGVPRGVLALAGVQALPATLLHFAAIWGTEQIMLPALKLAPPINDENPRSIAIDVLHHAVYAVAAGLIYDAIEPPQK